jgi:hypothetical protein
MLFKTTSLSKLILAGACCLVSGFNAFAQTSGGPDTYGYVWRDSNDPNGPAYNWIDIVNAPGAVQVTGLADDNIRGPFAIGFPFHYYWYDVTTFRVGSNGYLGFTTTPVAHPFPTIPTPTGIQNYMAAMACDLTFTDAGGATIAGAESWYWTSPGNDTLILSYINVPFWDQALGYTGSNTFQIILSNADSSITYQYLAQQGVYNNPANFVTIGIENNSGNIGLQHSHDIFPLGSYAIKFYYPSATTFSVSDASTVYNNNETSGGLFLSANGAPYEMKTQVRNTGNQPLASFNVASRVVNALNQNQVLSTMSSSALAPGATEDIVFPATFSPLNAGTYRHYNNTQLIGDATPSNNEKILELQVVDTTQASILLSFDTGVDAGLGGLSWGGGGGGAGVEFIPPFYPCNVTQARVFIAANTNLFGFSVLILDDDGVDGTPLTVLDSINVNSNNVITGAWNTVTFTTPVTISSGSFYIAWMMGGDQISVGQNQVSPVSNRTFEILGPASNPGSWAAYRYRELEDIMINAYISQVPISISEMEEFETVGDVYPNPTSGIAHLDFAFPNKAKELQVEIYDANGKLMQHFVHGKFVSNGKVQIDTATLPNGIYSCILSNGSEHYVRKLTVAK